jgi:hypothetical protein
MDGNPEINFRHSRVNGIVLEPFLSEERINEIKNFPTRDGDVFLVSYPKSGTHWTAQIIKEITNPSLPFGIDEEQINGGKLPFFELNDPVLLAAFPSPRYMFTHLPSAMMPHHSQHKLKYIYIARNPRDVAVSLFHFMRALKIYDWDGTWDEFFAYFIQGNVPSGSYFDRVLEWWKHKDDENLLFLKYEDMKKDMPGNIKKIAMFLGHDLSMEQIKMVVEKTTFSTMKANPKTNPDRLVGKLYKQGTAFSFMRKGIVGDWSNYFSENQVEELNKLYALRMEGTGLDFEFTE